MVDLRETPWLESAHAPRLLEVLVVWKELAFDFRDHAHAIDHGLPNRRNAVWLVCDGEMRPILS